MTYKNLIVWQKADEFAFEIYKVTKKLSQRRVLPESLWRKVCNDHQADYLFACHSGLSGIFLI